MSTVTGFTAARMLAIQNATIVSGVINGAGHLILTKFDGSTVDLGSVQGATGAVGPTGPTGPAADFGTYTEPLDDRGNVAGTVALDFSVRHVWRVNPTGVINFTFAGLPDATHVIPGTLIIANNNYAVSWPVGTKFPGGLAPSFVGVGEVVVSLLARSSGVTLGPAWTGVA